MVPKYQYVSNQKDYKTYDFKKGKGRHFCFANWQILQCENSSLFFL